MTQSVSDPRRRFELVVDAVLLVTCLVMSSAVLLRWTTAAPARQTRAQAIVAGDSAETIPGVSYQDASSTFVLYVRSSCHFCTESMPFYKRLNGSLRGTGVKLVAISDEDVSITKKYLDSYGVLADKVVSHRAQISGTPTLVQVSSVGKVKQVWLGQQNAAGERQILDAIAHP